MNQALKRKYREYNRRYFSGRLPKDTVVDWHYEIPGDSYGAIHIHGINPCRQIPESYGHCHGKHLILVNTSLWDFREVSYMTLLHEMNHLDVELRGNPYGPHGVMFQSGVHRLVRLGALDRLF
jgi:hypothetical protein